MGHDKMRQRTIVSLAVFSLVALIFISMLNVISTGGQGEPEIFSDPATVYLTEPGENFTLTIKVKNVNDLFIWQVALEFNDTVANITGWEIPKPDNVFGDNVIPVEPQIDVARSGRKYFVWGAFTFKTVNVAEGTLCKINFTTLNYGYTTLRLSTQADPILQPNSIWDGTKWVPSWYCMLKNGLNEDIAYTAKNCEVIIASEKTYVPPKAFFTATSVQFNTEGLLLLGNTTYFSKRDIIFNASESYDPDGEIVTYQWDFGDGTQLNSSEPVVYHQYQEAKAYEITLVVQDDDGLTSEPFTKSVKVGLVLRVLNWLYYLEIMGIIILVLIVVSVVWKIYSRKFRIKRL